MPLTLERPRGCLAPVIVDRVVDDPDSIRTIARAHGPYFMPARYLVTAAAANDAGVTEGAAEVPSHLIGPVWRGDWAIGGVAQFPEADALLHLEPFVEGARTMCGADAVVDPQQVFVNLSTPMPGSAFSHVDIPEFVGWDRSNAPGWLLQAMGTSRLFEDIRITIVTAVSWFHSGERGYFRYWPNGRDAESVRHEAMWNTAVVGDNDFMHHKVERIGRADQEPVQGLTIDSTLTHDGEAWQVMEGGRSLATYTDDDVRISLSWKARVYASDADRAAAEAGEGTIAAEEIVARFAAALDEPIAATGPDAFASTALRDQLQSRWAGYVPG